MLNTNFILGDGSFHCKTILSFIHHLEAVNFTLSYILIEIVIFSLLPPSSPSEIQVLGRSPEWPITHVVAIPLAHHPECCDFRPELPCLALNYMFSL